MRRCVGPVPGASRSSPERLEARWPCRYHVDTVADESGRNLGDWVGPRDANGPVAHGEFGLRESVAGSLVATVARVIHGRLSRDRKTRVRSAGTGHFTISDTETTVPASPAERKPPGSGVSLPGASCIHALPPGCSRTTRALSFLPLAALLALAACGTSTSTSTSSQADTSLALRAAPVAVRPALEGARPADSLLERPVLQRIVELQERRDGAALIRALRSREPAVRARAAFALGSVQDKAAVPSLERLLNDGHAEVRADAAFALGQAGDSAATPALIRALGRERDRTVRHELLAALGKVGAASALPRLLSLIPASDSADAPDLALAIARFALRGVESPAAVSRVVAGLTSPMQGLRLMSAYYFGRVRRTAAWAAQARTVRAALDRMTPDDPAAMQLVLGLGRLKDTLDDARLEHWMLHAGDWRIAVNAARALASRAAERRSVDDSLLAALDDAQRPDQAWTHVAIAAADALASGDSLPATVLDAAQAWIDNHASHWRVAGALAPALARGGRAPSLLGWIAARADPRAREMGIAALGVASDTESLRWLFDNVDDADADAATADVDALHRRWRGAGGDTTTYAAAFKRALKRPDVAVRVAAAGALGDSAFLRFGAVAALRSARATLVWPRDLEAGQAIDGALKRLGQPISAGAGQRSGHREAEGTAAAGTAEASAPARHDSIDWAMLRRWGPRPRLVLDTDRGRIVVELDVDEAPLTAQTVMSLALAGRYDDVPFHRVVPNFVIQGGDFARGDGYGGPGFVIRSEFTRLRYTRGTIGMASAGKDTEGSQYFITHSMQPHLDGKYTAFGRVVTGMDVVDRILVGDRVTHASVEPSH